MSFLSLIFFFFFKQKTAYEMRISDWSSDVCSSDLVHHRQKARGEEETHRIVAIPPLGQRILHPGKGAVAARAEQADRDGQIVDQVQHRSEERRVGKGCVGTCRSRGSPYH